MGWRGWLGWALSALAFVGCDAGLQTGRNEAPIVGGTPSGPNDFPSAGALLVSATVNGQAAGGATICSGTLIAPDVVLTAAHCVDDIGLPPDATVTWLFSFSNDTSDFGVVDLTPPPLTTEVSSLIAHPLYGQALPPPQMGNLGTYNDVALLFLSAAVTTRAPAVVADALDAPTLVVSTPVDAVGYGVRQPAGEDNGIKYQGPSEITDINQHEMEIGAGVFGPEKCYGDSGGPTYMIANDGRAPTRRLIGVASYTQLPSPCESGSVDMRADAFRGWIDGEMVAACQRGDRVPGICATWQGLRSPVPFNTNDGGVADVQPPPPFDAGLPPDTGRRDTGVRPDTGVWDAGRRDTGRRPPPPPRDAGFRDTGRTFDAGPPPPPRALLQTAEPVGCSAVDHPTRASPFGLLMLSFLILLRRRRQS